MTSRVSFPKLLLETLRRHLAAVLITVLAFFIHLISFFLNIQNMLNQHVMTDTMYPMTATQKEYIIEGITEVCSPNMWNAILAMLIGVYLAFDFFKYMHSKKETDFYESMPIRKQTWFLTLFTASIGIFSLLATVTTLLELAIVYSVGYGSAMILQNMLWGLLCMLGIFLATWTTTILAMIMTGHTIIAFLGFGIFASYIPLIISNLIPTYSNVFFDTYVYHDLNTIYYYFSPITLAYKASYSFYYNGNVWNIANHWTYLLGCFVFALILGIIAYMLFLRRPSETAGRAMAFEKMNPVIRILIVIPIALYAGLFLNEIAAYGSFVWLIFGVVFVAFLMHGIIECIFQFDIKALVSKKRQLLITILFCLAFVFVFWADLFQYDQYMPNAEDVKVIHIDTYLFNADSSGAWEQYKDGLTGDSVELALQAVRDIRSSSESSDNIEYRYMNDFTVTYELKNGVKKVRRYSYYGNEFPKSLDKLSATEDFKNDFNLLYHYEEADITSISVSNGMEHFELPITKAQQKELCEIYLKEYRDFTISESLSKQAVYSLCVEYPRENKDYTLTDNYKVFADFTETISYLEKLGVTSFANAENVKLENLEIHSEKYEQEGIPKYISEKNQLDELKQYMILGDFMNYHLDYGKDYVMCTLRYTLNNNTRYMDIYLKTSDISKALAE